MFASSPEILRLSNYPNYRLTLKFTAQSPKRHSAAKPSSIHHDRRAASTTRPLDQPSSTRRVSASLTIKVRQRIHDDRTRAVHTLSGKGGVTDSTWSSRDSQPSNDQHLDDTLTGADRCSSFHLRSAVYDPPDDQSGLAGPAPQPAPLVHAGIPNSYPTLRSFASPRMIRIEP